MEILNDEQFLAQVEGILFQSALAQAALSDDEFYNKVADKADSFLVTATTVKMRYDGIIDKAKEYARSGNAKGLIDYLSANYPKFMPQMKAIKYTTVQKAVANPDAKKIIDDLFTPAEQSFFLGAVKPYTSDNQQTASTATKTTTTNNNTGVSIVSTAAENSIYDFTVKYFGFPTGEKENYDKRKQLYTQFQSAGNYKTYFNPDTPYTGTEAQNNSFLKFFQENPSETQKLQDLYKTKLVKTTTSTTTTTTQPTETKNVGTGLAKVAYYLKQIGASLKQPKIGFSVAGGIVLGYVGYKQLTKKNTKKRKR